MPAPREQGSSSPPPSIERGGGAAAVGGGRLHAPTARTQQLDRSPESLEELSSSNANAFLRELFPLRDMALALSRSARCTPTPDSRHIMNPNRGSQTGRGGAPSPQAPPPTCSASRGP